LAFWKTRSFAAVWPAYAYIGYLLTDLLFIPPGRLAKWFRNGSAPAFVMLWGAGLLPLFGLPRPVAGAALLATLAGATLPYLYERGRVADGYLQGLVLACLLELGAQYLAPTPAGAHVALPLFAAAYAWERRTVFWRWSVPVLGLYAALTGWWLDGGVELLPHVLGGLLAWLFGRVLPRRRPAFTSPQPPPSTLGLDLRS
jgi:hypothetical protein